MTWIKVQQGGENSKREMSKQIRASSFQRFLNSRTLPEAWPSGLQHTVSDGTVCEGCGAQHFEEPRLPVPMLVEEENSLWSVCQGNLTDGVERIGS